MATSLTLISKEAVAANIRLFTFKPSDLLTWAAGQFIRVELPHTQPDSEGTKRYFTIASAPDDHHVQIATRITSSSFKQALAALRPGGKINVLDLPAGDFVWPHSSSKPLIFAAQGIGITPVRSMIRQRLHEGLPIPATLLYSNVVPGVPFAHELTAWSKHPDFKLHHLDAPITAPILAGLTSSLAGSLVYVTGPKSLIKLLAPPFNLPVASLKQDQFPNYAAGDY